jgi:hypothetical protein
MLDCGNGLRVVSVLVVVFVIIVGLHSIISYSSDLVYSFPNKLSSTT